MFWFLWSFWFGFCNFFSPPPGRGRALVSFMCLSISLIPPISLLWFRFVHPLTTYKRCLDNLGTITHHHHPRLVFLLSAARRRCHLQNTPAGNERSFVCFQKLPPPSPPPPNAQISVCFRQPVRARAHPSRCKSACVAASPRRRLASRLAAAAARRPSSQNPSTCLLHSPDNSHPLHSPNHRTTRGNKQEQ